MFYRDEFVESYDFRCASRFKWVEGVEIHDGAHLLKVDACQKWKPSFPTDAFVLNRYDF